MSLADRFPRLRNRSLPDWVENAQDDDDDLVEAARKSQEEQANRLMGLDPS
jgi:hypothetical protein